MVKTLVVIPARYGSSRFPGKPLAKIAGKEMLLRVVDIARKGTAHRCANRGRDRGRADYGLLQDARNRMPDDV